MQELFLATLKEIDKCKTLEEMNSMSEYVYNTFHGIKLNTYFWHCRNRIHKQTAIIDGTYREYE